MCLLHLGYCIPSSTQKACRKVTVTLPFDNLCECLKDYMVQFLWNCENFWRLFTVVISCYPPPIPSYINIFEALLQNRQQLSDTLGKMSFWYHCKEHMFSFNLKSKPSSYSYFLRYDNFCMCKTINSFSGSGILRKRPLSFPFL